MPPDDPIAQFHHRFVPAADAGATGASAPAEGAPPALLLLHGTGGDEDDLLSLGLYLAPGAALLSPRGRVLENGMPRFFRRFAEGIFDVADLKLRTAELGAFVRAARERYGISDRRLYAVGFSNGANMAVSALLLDPDLLDGALLFRAMVPLTPDEPPRLERKPVFIGAGRNDPIVDPRETERLATMLRAAGADVTLHWSGMGHALDQEEIDAGRAWLRARVTSRA